MILDTKPILRGNASPQQPGHHSSGTLLNPGGSSGALHGFPHRPCSFHCFFCEVGGGGGGGGWGGGGGIGDL
jgi:hypothetical protein